MPGKGIETNSQSIWLTDLTHSLQGPLEDTDATVTYTVYRANGDLFVSGNLDWVAGRGYHGTFVSPTLAPGARETLRVVVRAEAAEGGAIDDFVELIDISDLAA